MKPSLYDPIIQNNSQRFNNVIGSIQQPLSLMPNHPNKQNNAAVSRNQLNNNNKKMTQTQKHPVIVTLSARGDKGHQVPTINEQLPKTADVINSSCESSIVGTEQLPIKTSDNSRRVSNTSKDRQPYPTSFSNHRKHNNYLS